MLYGPMGITPNSREESLLSWRQFLLMSWGLRMQHRRDFYLHRAAFGAEGTYQDIFERPQMNEEKHRALVDRLDSNGHESSTTTG